MGVAHLFLIILFTELSVIRLADKWAVYRAVIIAKIRFPKLLSYAFCKIAVEHFMDKCLGLTLIVKKSFRPGENQLMLA